MQPNGFLETWPFIRKENKLLIAWVREWILYFFRRKYSAPFRDNTFIATGFGVFWAQKRMDARVLRMLDCSSDLAGLMVAVTLRNSQSGSVYCIRWIERYLQSLVFILQSSEESINFTQELKQSIKGGPSPVIHRKVQRFTRFVFVHNWSQFMDGQWQTEISYCWKCDWVNHLKC